MNVGDMDKEFSSVTLSELKNITKKIAHEITIPQLITVEGELGVLF